MGWLGLSQGTRKVVRAQVRQMGQSLGWEDPLEKEMATVSGILAWETPWTEEPAGATIHRVVKGCI